MIHKTYKERLIAVTTLLLFAGIIGLGNAAIIEGEKKHRKEEIKRELKSFATGISVLNTIPTNDDGTLKKAIENIFRNNSDVIYVEINRRGNGERKTVAKAGKDSATENNKENSRIVEIPIAKNGSTIGQIKATVKIRVDKRKISALQTMTAIASATTLILLVSMKRRKKLNEDKVKIQKEEDLDSKRKIKETAAQSIRMALEANSDGWWEWNKERKISLVSKKLIQTLEISSQERRAIVGCEEYSQDWWREYFKVDKTVEDFMNQNIDGKKTLEVNYRTQKKGEVKYARISRTVLDKIIYEEERVIFSIEDITSKIRKNKLIEAKAFSDNLTGLANRAAFEIELEKISAERWRKNVSYALFVIDIDNFKHLNDTNGHVVGDFYLREISKRLKERLRPTDFIGRIGGDEFVVIAKFKYGSKNEIEERSFTVGEKIRKEISKTFFVKGIELNYQCSIGICTDRMQTNETMSIFDYADIALYKAKEGGRDRTMFFEEVMKREVIRTETTRVQLERAIKNKAIEVEIQPIADISLSKNKNKYLNIVGYEVLLRCKEINIEIETIIKIAEKTGQVREITNAVIQKIGEKLEKGEILLKEKQTLSINISAIELLDMNFPERLLVQLSRAGLNCSQIYIEVTETAFISNIEIAKDNMKKLREAGIKFAMDDFGTGYASISMLRHIAVERIKLDQSYIEHIENEVDQALIKTVIWMARALKVELVAEGIEREDQLKALTALGCKLGQGFLLDQETKVRAHLHDEDREVK